MANVKTSAAINRVADAVTNRVIPALNQKAKLDLTNVTVPTANSGKFLTISSTGKVQYSTGPTSTTTDTSNLANKNLDNVLVPTTNAGRVLEVSATGGLSFSTSYLKASDASTTYVPLQYQSVTANQNKYLATNASGAVQLVSAPEESMDDASVTSLEAAVIN